MRELLCERPKLDERETLADIIPYIAFSNYQMNLAQYETTETTRNLISLQICQHSSLNLLNLNQV